MDDGWRGRRLVDDGGDRRLVDDGGAGGWWMMEGQEVGG